MCVKIEYSKNKPCFLCCRIVFYIASWLHFVKAIDVALVLQSGMHSGESGLSLLRHESHVPCSRKYVNFV